MKKCLKCGFEKEFSEFGIDAQKPDGLNSYCKVCIRKRNLEQKKKNPEATKKYADEYRKKNRLELREKSRITYYIDWEKRTEQGRRSYYKHRERIAKKRALKSRTAEARESNRLRQAAWRAENKSRVAEIVGGWKRRNPHKSACHSLIVWAVKAKVLIRKEECEECGNVCKTQGHHEDYSKPLEVRWLCADCHAKKHQIYR